MDALVTALGSICVLSRSSKEKEYKSDICLHAKVVTAAAVRQLFSTAGCKRKDQWIFLADGEDDDVEDIIVSSAALELRIFVFVLAWRMTANTFNVATVGTRMLMFLVLVLSSRKFYPHRGTLSTDLF